MKERDCLSMGYIATILENSPMAVFVSALDDHRLLYVNHRAKELFPEADHPDTTCFSIVGYDAPCPFCHSGKINQTELTVREYFHPHTNRTFQLSGKLIDWDGQPAHIEYILDITAEKREEQQHRKTEEELQSTFDSIPCGLCVYQVEGDWVKPVFHNAAFYEIVGYSDEHIQSVEQRTSHLGIHPEDVDLFCEKVKAVIRHGGNMRYICRMFHDRRAEYRWIQLEATVRTDKDGCKLLYAIYSDVSEQKRLEEELTAANEKMRKTEMEMGHLVNSIPGGIASYQVVDGRFIPVYYSDGVPALSGHTREEYDEIIGDDALNIIYGPDRDRLLAQAYLAIEKGSVLEVSYRILHKDGSLTWIHLNGRRMGSLSEDAQFYAVFTGMSAETQLFKNIANETADGIYIIDKENYELLFTNESKTLFSSGKLYEGRKCYEVLHGKKEPCTFCTLQNYGADGIEHTIIVDGTDRSFTSRMKETDWNGIPAYVQYIRDVTDEVKNRKEKEKLEVYYQALVKNLPGGIAVVRCEPDGCLTPEFLSDGFATMMGMLKSEAKLFYEKDILAGIHPDDRPDIEKQLLELVKQGKGYRVLKGRVSNGDGYIWVKAEISMLQTNDDVKRLYFLYSDITGAVQEQERLRCQYEELIYRHYHKPGPDTLILGHCNITKNKIIEIWDSTNSNLLQTYGTVREEFFTGISNLIDNSKEQQAFLNTYLNAPSQEAFSRNETEKVLRCFVKLPQDEKGRYVEFKMNLVKAPDTGDLTGILTVTDVTEQTVSDRILHQLSVNSHDYVVDLNLETDTAVRLTCNQNAKHFPPPKGCHSKRVAYLASSKVVPKDREAFTKALAPETIRRRLEEEGPYTFMYSIVDESGDIRAQNMTVFAVDLRLSRVCLVCTDITESTREQRGLLNMMAYSFELMGLIEVGNGRLTMYTRETVLKNLPPYRVERYEDEIQVLNARYGMPEDRAEVEHQFNLDTMLERLENEPTGYDFLFPYRGEDGLRYKQVGVLWGDDNHQTICMVRADVTDILTAERKTKKKLEKALAQAEEASRAKSDFLSAMSHDIRTPMNAIMGMTTLALSRLEDQNRVEDCLRKISTANKHLLSLVNDILDMSRIEHSKIVLNQMDITLDEILEQLCDIMEPQAKSAGLAFSMQKAGVTHEAFIGDPLRLNQILGNLLSNAIKFTPEGGQVKFLVEELPTALGGERVRYRFTVRDTGIGMPQKFLEQVFEPFSRSQSTSRIEGTGLGLSIAKRMVDMMNGEISVESKEMEGSVFQVELEFAIALEEKRSHLDNVESDGMWSEKPLDGCTFLMAEDHPVNAELISELLKMFGANAVVKPDGLQALQAFMEKDQGTYDAILLDIQMPVMNGYEAARAIRDLDRPDAESIPIVAMTANAFAEDVQAALDAGMNAHVSKPIDVDVLQKTLVKVVNR